MSRLRRAADDVGRPPQQGFDRYRVVGRERHEGRVGAVLEQAPHQIGEEVAVAADRRIGAIGEFGVIFAQARIERLAHAVQALEFESALAAGELQHGRDRQRIVGGELRKEARPQRQQPLVRSRHN